MGTDRRTIRKHMKHKPHTSGQIKNWEILPGKTLFPQSVPWMFAHRHLSVLAAQNAKLRPRCRPKTYKTDTSRVLAKAMRPGKSYFGRSSPGAKVHRSVRSSAFVGHPQGAQLVDVAEALGRPLCPGNVAGNTFFAQSVHWSPTGTCQEGQHRTQNSDHVAVP
jgi:hypothetical protein